MFFELFLNRNPLVKETEEVLLFILWIICNFFFVVKVFKLVMCIVMVIKKKNENLQNNNILLIQENRTSSKANNTLITTIHIYEIGSIWNINHFYYLPKICRIFLTVFKLEEICVDINRDENMSFRYIKRKKKNAFKAAIYVDIYLLT